MNMVPQEAAPLISKFESLRMLFFRTVGVEQTWTLLGPLLKSLQFALDREGAEQWSL